MEAHGRLAWWERGFLLFVVALFIFLGVMTEIRSAYLSRRMGDFGCYARGAWAVRTDGDMYAVTCDNNWHYNYPPFLAILMTPLADPPAGEDLSGMTPYAVSVAVWYLFSVLCLAVAVHWLASALEAKSADPSMRQQSKGCRRWWYVRILPVLICIAPIGQALTRGQVNPLVLALLCGLVAGWIRGHCFRAGLCLAWAACIKLYPIYLLIYPLWRRNGRCLAGCGAGLFLGLVALPLAVFGPARTYEIYETYANVLLGPALSGAGDDTRYVELLSVNATWSQAFKVVVHKTLHLDPHTRPAQIAPWLEWSHRIVGLLLTLLVLLAGRRSADRATTIAFTWGNLFMLMIMLCPICHMHYFTFALPLVMALLMHHWEGKQTVRIGIGLTLLLLVFVVAHSLPQFDELEILRDLGLPMYSTLLLMGTCLVRMWTSKPQDQGHVAPNVPRLAA